MTSGINNKAQEKVLGFLLMRFKVPPAKSLKIAKKWLDNHPNSTWEYLANSIRNNLVHLENEQLIDLYDETIIQLVNEMRGVDGLEIKNRNYRLKNYSLCFIGSEAVEWIQAKYDISKSEAVKLGERLIEEKIIHHVTDDHKFKSDYLFYRFYLDE